MSYRIELDRPEPIGQRLVVVEAGFLAAACTFALVMSMLFPDAVTFSRLLPVLILLLLIQVLVSPRLFFCREFALYLAFVAYLFLTLLWTPDPVLGMNTLFPAVDFVLIQIVMGSLVRFGDARAVLLGCLIGLWMGAGVVTYVVGFPFMLPKDMSYNAVAAVYLFGLYAALTLACLTRSKVLLLVAALFAMAHIIATTSIKTNLGVLLGAVAAVVVYFRESLRVLRRHVLVLLLGICAVAYGIVSSNVAIEGLLRGVGRVTLGVNVLQAREDRSGYQGFEERAYWAQEGLRRWGRNPVFGHGVEAFRADYGITSHSVPIDLLYNTGLIGLVLFYAMFGSLAVRLFKSQASRSLRAVTFAFLICNVFITLSGTVFYQAFLAAFIAVAAAMLVRPSQNGSIHERVAT